MDILLKQISLMNLVLDAIDENSKISSMSAYFDIQNNSWKWEDDHILILSSQLETQVAWS